MDNSFGTSGIATIPFGASSYVNSVKATTDGGYVATGFEGGAGNAFVIKLDANGNLDSSFDSDGIVQLLDLGDGSSIIQNSNNKYLITGSGISGGITVAQLNTDGSLDNSFGTNGLFNFDDPNYGENQPTIIAAGSSYIVAGSMVDIISGDADPFLIKITAAGTIDASFGVNGVSHPTLANNQSISSVARGNDGSLVGVGMSEGSDYKFFAFKTNANGALDANFGTNGILEIGDPGWNDLRDIKKTADGGFITFGESSATGSWTLTMIKIDSQGNY